MRLNQEDGAEEAIGRKIERSDAESSHHNLPFLVTGQLFISVRLLSLVLMRPLLLSALLLCCCTSRPASEQVVGGAPPSRSSAASSAAVGAANLPLCCDSFEQIKQLDGTRVTLEGVYNPVILSKRPARELTPESAPGNPATVSIESPSQFSVMLGIYHSASGPRPAEEVDRLRGKKVRVIGTLHAHTPSQTDPSGTVMQTMIGPYIEPETIELLR